MHLNIIKVQTQLKRKWWKKNKKIEKFMAQICHRRLNIKFTFLNETFKKILFSYKKIKITIIKTIVQVFFLTNMIFSKSQILNRMFQQFFGSPLLQRPPVQSVFQGSRAYPVLWKNQTEPCSIPSWTSPTGRFGRIPITVLQDFILKNKATN